MEKRARKFKQVSFAEGLSDYIIDQEVEIYLGDSDKLVKQADYDINKKSVLIGRVIDIIGDLIILESMVADKKTNIFINGWAVKTIIPLGGLTCKNVFIDQQVVK